VESTVTLLDFDSMPSGTTRDSTESARTQDNHLSPDADSAPTIPVSSTLSNIIRDYLPERTATSFILYATLRNVRFHASNRPIHGV
jgi:hypothetical protein